MNSRILYLALVLLVPSAAAGQTPDESGGFLDVTNDDRLTGDWGGARSAWEEKGIEIGLSLTTIYQHNVAGGMQTHRGHRITGSSTYELTLDPKKLGLWGDGVFYVAASSGFNDGIGEDRVGNLFGVNGAATGDVSINVDEMWYEQSLWNGKARLRLGKIDIGVDFDTNAYANDETSQFLNPALIGTGNIPMPDLGLGIQLIYEPYDWFYAGVVVADAQAHGRETGFATTFHNEDYLYAGVEIGLMPTWNSPRGDLPGAYRFGVWYDPQPKEEFINDLDGRLTAPNKRDDVGFYFNMDQMLYKENADVADTQGLGFFFRYGFAHQDTNEIEHFWSIGAQYQGLLPERGDDVLGFGFAQGVMSDNLRGIEGMDRESVYEFYYSAQVHPWLVVTPDLQYIVNPGSTDGNDSFVAGIRLQMTF